MTKRPHVMKDPEDGFKSAEDSHKPHHHPSRNHVNRHHKKHEHANTIINPSATTVRSTVKQDRATEERVVSSTKENKSRFLNVTEATESSDTDTITTTSESTSSVTSLSSTSKPKKAPRRQKAKEPVGNRTEVEDDKAQRRRKVHHHRRNNTLFTNSVHDEVPIVNVSETIETTTVTTAASRYHRTRYTTTVPTTTMKETTIHRETVTGVTNDFTKENTVGTNAQTILSTGSETSSETTESQTTTPSFTRTSTIIEGGRSRTTFPAVTTTSVTIPITVSSNKRFPKVQKNRTNNLGPSRIDVTILESPDRRSRQGQWSKYLRFIDFSIWWM